MSKNNGKEVLIRPMLASPAPTMIKFPLFASAKIDGIRSIIKEGRAKSRVLKDIPNRHIQSCLGHSMLNGLDGELTVGEPFHRNVMQATTSGVMSREGEPDFTFWLFDFWNDPIAPYSQRHQILVTAIKAGILSEFPFIKLLKQTIVRSAEELAGFEVACLRQGYEGVMLRSMDGTYKYGRSTAREGGLLKLKRFTDSEAIIIGAEELQRNNNEATTNALGYTERSSAKDGKSGGGMLGALKVKDLKTKIEFSIGTGYDEETRIALWSEWKRNNLKGRVVRYKHFEGGVKDAPRFPVFDGFRHPIDIGEPK